MPVFNGEQFVRHALDSLLRQSFADFELIISDNASTDATGEICRRYSQSDSRIRYHRSDVNRGASWNFNRTFSLAAGDCFMWAAHDDAHAPDYLRQCVAVLDGRPEVVLCFAQEMGMDESGTATGLRPYPLDNGLKRPSERFAALMNLNRGSPPIFGLMRSEILRRTPRIGPYVAADLVLLAELALCGEFFQVPEPLLWHREHKGRSVYANRSWHEAAVWHDTSNRGKILLPHWRVLAEYRRSVARSKLPRGESLACYKHIARWARYNLRPLWQDLTNAAGASLNKARARKCKPAELKRADTLRPHSGSTRNADASVEASTGNPQA